MVPLNVNCYNYFSQKLNSIFPLKWLIFTNVMKKGAHNLKFSLFNEKIAKQNFFHLEIYNADTMSLQYTCRHKPSIFARQTEPPLWRPSLRYAANEPPLYSTTFLKSWFLCVMKNVNYFVILQIVMIRNKLPENKKANT